MADDNPNTLEEARKQYPDYRSTIDQAMTNMAKNRRSMQADHHDLPPKPDKTGRYKSMGRSGSYEKDMDY